MTDEKGRNLVDRLMLRVLKRLWARRLMRRMETSPTCRFLANHPSSDLLEGEEHVSELYQWRHWKFLGFAISAAVAALTVIEGFAATL